MEKSRSGRPHAQIMSVGADLCIGGRRDVDTQALKAARVAETAG
jgi:hypothetical protein